MELSDRSCQYGVVALLGVLLLAGCGDGRDDASGASAAVQCGTPRLASATAAPFEWIEVAEIPDGFGPAVAEVTAADTKASTLAPVVEGDGLSALRVPLHPSFRIDGGEVSVRILSDAGACDAIPLTIDPIDPAPGAMAETTSELRAAIDEMARSGNPNGGRIDPGRLVERGGELHVLGLSALLALPKLEHLERLMEEGAIAAESAEDAETLDALAGHLELPRRMRELRALAASIRAFTGDLALTVPPPGAAPTARRSDGASEIFRFASYANSPIPMEMRSTAVPQSEGPDELACPEGRENLFSIDSPAELDDYMRAQDRAARFAAGAADEEGGSATGTLFGDIGEVMSLIEMAGKGGKAIAEAWEVFSDALLMTKEAAAGLLPSDMELSVTASPAEFDEDSDEIGSWTAGARVTSDGLELGERAVEAVTEMIAEQYAGRFLDNVSVFGKRGSRAASDVMGESKLADGYEKFFEEAGKEVDDKLFKDRANELAEQEVGEILERLGATRISEGFRISGDCWNLDDMSASDGGSTPSGDPRPPLVTGQLSGGSVEFIGDSDREFEVVDVGPSRLDVRTAEGYAKQTGELFGSPIGTSYAFGGTQFTGHTTITVEPIDIAVNPAVRQVEPGEVIDYEAVVRHALDPSVEWTSRAGGFVRTVDRGDGTHEATFVTPENPDEYPITIEVVSTSRGGAREDGVPVRKGVAHVQLADPIIDIQPATACLSAGDTKTFRAVVYGAENQRVRWSDSGGPGSIDQGGVLRAGSGEGTVTITAAWAEDPDVAASVDIEVGRCEASWSARVNGGPGGGDYSGGDARATILDGGVVSIGLHNRDEGGCPMIGFSPKSPTAVAGSVPAEGFVGFIFCEGDFGNARGGSPYELSNGAGAPFHPPPATLTLREISEDWVIGEFRGQMFEAANGEERNNYDVRFGVSAEFRARVQ